MAKPNALRRDDAKACIITAQGGWMLLQKGIVQMSQIMEYGRKGLLQPRLKILCSPFFHLRTSFDV